MSASVRTVGTCVLSWGERSREASAPAPLRAISSCEPATHKPKHSIHLHHTHNNANPGGTYHFAAPIRRAEWRRSTDRCCRRRPASPVLQSTRRLDCCSGSCCCCCHRQRCRSSCGLGYPTFSLHVNNNAPEHMQLHSASLPCLCYVRAFGVLIPRGQAPVRSLQTAQGRQQDRSEPRQNRRLKAQHRPRPGKYRIANTFLVFRISVRWVWKQAVSCSQRDRVGCRRYRRSASPHW